MFTYWRSWSRCSPFRRIPACRCTRRACCSSRSGSSSMGRTRCSSLPSSRRGTSRYPASCRGPGTNFQSNPFREMASTSKQILTFQRINIVVGPILSLVPGFSPFFSNLTLRYYLSSSSCKKHLAVNGLEPLTTVSSRTFEPQLHNFITHRGKDKWLNNHVQTHVDRVAAFLADGVLARRASVSVVAGALERLLDATAELAV